MVLFSDDQQHDSGSVRLDHVPVIYTFNLAGYRDVGDQFLHVAFAGCKRHKSAGDLGVFQENGFDFVPRSRWPLDSISAPMVGSGRRGAKA